MARWEEKPVMSKDRLHGHQRDINPSFSSTLLDAIYRSVDESNSTKGDQEELILYRGTMRKKHNNYALKQGSREVERACTMEKWKGKKVSCEKVAVPRKSMADCNNKQPGKDLASVLLNSCSSSSESSYGSGGFSSSSESESFYGLNLRSTPPTQTMEIRPRPIKTSTRARAGGETDMHHDHHYPQKLKHVEGGEGFNKTKSKALKIYGNLRKIKQPMSPGSRLASFLNSLFNSKKTDISSSSSYKDTYGSSKLKSEQASSTCSSTSSFSRSCLSKTPSSRGKLSNGTKRSVRFCPVSVIVDEDCKPCGHKTLYRTEESLMKITTTNEELKFHVLNENRGVDEVARKILNKCQIRKKQDIEMREACNGNEGSSESDQDEEDDDDAASYASSDLFELDNLSAIGIERYRDELPVYETTHLSNNRAIANGSIL